MFPWPAHSLPRRSCSCSMNPSPHLTSSPDTTCRTISPPVAHRREHDRPGHALDLRSRLSRPPHRRHVRPPRPDRDRDRLYPGRRQRPPAGPCLRRPGRRDHPLRSATPMRLERAVPALFALATLLTWKSRFDCSTFPHTSSRARSRSPRRFLAAPALLLRSLASTLVVTGRRPSRQRRAWRGPSGNDRVEPLGACRNPALGPSCCRSRPSSRSLR